MNIVICLDNNYFEPCFLLINSIIHTNKDININFYFVFEDLKQKYVDLFKSLSDYKVITNFCKIDINLLKNCPIREGDHVSLATYYRILLPEILPETVDKILYLDCDMLCFNSLTDFYNIDLTGFALAASPDAQCNNKRRKELINLKSETLYFGAGTLLINLKYWRENDIEQKCLKYIDKNHEKLLWHDQDTLNAVLEGKIKFVDFRYNFYETFFKVREKSTIDNNLWDKVLQDKKNIVILHYTQTEKPCFFECEHPLKSIYREFYKKIFGKSINLKFKYRGKRKFSFIKRKIMSIIFNFKMNKNYTDLPKNLIEDMKKKLFL